MAATLPAYLLSEDEWIKKREDPARHFDVRIADAATERIYRKHGRDPLVFLSIRDPALNDATVPFRFLGISF